MIKITILGGTEEIGKNMMALETDTDIIVIDCGISFATKKQSYGVSYLVQDFSYLLGKSDKVKAVIYTHAHEDHIGNAAYFNNCFPKAQVIGSNFTIEYLKEKYKEHDWKEAEFIKAKSKQKIKINNITIQFIHTNHSVPGSFMLAITTPDGVIMHSGDFKIDYLSAREPRTDLLTLKKYAEKKVDLLLIESTNAEKEGTSKSENAVTTAFEKIVQDCNEHKKRVVVTMFATNVSRLLSFVEIAQKYDRRVILVGASLKTSLEAAKKTGQFNIDNDNFIEETNTYYYSPEQLMFIATGCQAEKDSGLEKLTEGTKMYSSLGRDDVVVFSSSVIPGNEIPVEKLKTKIKSLGAEVIDRDSEPDIHASGHAQRGELRLLINTLKPKYLIPIHGEGKHMDQNKILAEEIVDDKNIFIPRNGMCYELNKNVLSQGKKIFVKANYLDPSRETVLSERLLADRIDIAKNGILLVTAIIKSNHETIYNEPIVEAISMPMSKEIADSIKKTARSLLLDNIDALQSRNPGQKITVKNNITDKLNLLMNTQFNMYPFVIVNIFDLSQMRESKINNNLVTGTNMKDLLNIISSAMYPEEE